MDTNLDGRVDEGVVNGIKSSYRYVPLVAKDHAQDGKYHLLLACSGSVATIKLPNIIRALSEHPNLSIRVVVTESAAKFLQGQSEEQPHLNEIRNYANVDAVYHDEDEWKIPWTRGAPILHIELRRWADVLVIAPLSANSLAKIANGICDSLLASVVRAWQVEARPSQDAEAVAQVGGEQKTIMVAPAMNTAMWRHPLTATHLREMHSGGSFHWFEVLKPVERELACGDTGDGAMRDWSEIVRAIESKMALRSAGPR